MVAEFNRLLAVPDQSLTPRELREVRELVDRQFEADGQLKTLAAMLASPAVWQVAGLWVEEATLQFLSRVADSPALLDDADVWQCLMDLAEESRSRDVRRRVGVILTAKDVDLARMTLLMEYGVVFVSMFEEAEPTLAPALAACGVTAPAEITSLAAARAALAASGIDMEGVDDDRLLAVANEFNWHLHTLAIGERFEELAALTQPERAAGVMLTLYKQQLQNPTPALSEPPSDWLD